MKEVTIERRDEVVRVLRSRRWFVQRHSLVEPIAELNKIKIEDNGEPLVDLKKYCPHIAFNSEPDFWGEPRLFYARRTVADMLNKAQSFLPKGYKLYITGVYPTLEKQRKIYQRVYRRFKRAHPHWPQHILRRQTNRFVHPPDVPTPPGHCTGGAIDLTILGPDGKELNMTAPYKWGTPNSRKVAATYAEGITEEARYHRQLLIDAMSQAGFTNYAGEWWHWSYGDSCWAWRLGRKTAIYGIAEPPENSDPTASRRRAGKRRSR